MKEIDPRMERILTAQLKAIFWNAIIALVVSFGYVIYYWDSEAGVYSSFERIAIAAIASYLISRVLNFITLSYFQYKNYDGHYGEMVQDAAYASNLIRDFDATKVNNVQEQVVVTIMETPEKPIGKYMDTDFFEWLDIKGTEGQPIRCNFVGTIEPHNTHQVPDGCLLIPPGLIYQVATV